MSQYFLLFSMLTVLFITACDQYPKINTQFNNTATSSTITQKSEIFGKSEQLKPVADITAGMQLSDSCQECHGRDGNKTVAGSPYIAGQQTRYLLSAMKSYISGKRKNDGMKTALQSFSETDLLNLATYYNGQTSNWKQLKSIAKTKAIIVNKKTIAMGKRKAKICAGCHGEKGNTPVNGVAALAGLPPEYFRSAILSYFNKNRHEKTTVMNHFKNTISKSDINYLAAYFSTQTPKITRYAGKGDVKIGKKLGSKSCNNCHGVNGNSGNPTIPSLTGQNIDYLIKALGAYKNGLRKNKMMQDVVTTLKSNHIENLAAYYANQKPKKLVPNIITQSKGFNPIRQGGNIAVACNGCHGVKGNSTLSNTPSLAGLDPQYLSVAINAYINGQRRHDTMKNFVANLSEMDVEKVSLYYATQMPTAMVNTIKGDAAVGEAIANACTSCHGDDGNSSQANIPSIAGQDPEYIVSAIKAYKDGKRLDKNMQTAVAELTNSDIANYAAYFSAQTRIKPEIRILEAPEVLAEKCFRCHGRKGLGTDNKIPRLAGQLESYLFNSLRQYSNETRKQSTMHAMSAHLSLIELKAIAKYFAHQK